MISKVEKNYFLDILLGIIGLVCITTGLIIDRRPQAFLAVFGIVKNLHIWTGYSVAVLASLHLLWHLAWVQAMTRSMAKAPRKMWLAAACAITAVVFCVGIAVSSPAGKPSHGPDKAATEGAPKILQQ
jgi:hypothetical protein